MDIKRIESEPLIVAVPMDVSGLVASEIDEADWQYLPAFILADVIVGCDTLTMPPMSEDADSD
jgi:hypothetical protein